MASITVPCFNQYPFTRHCLQALFPFICPARELIVIDNASTDARRAPWPMVHLARAGWACQDRSGNHFLDSPSHPEGEPSPPKSVTPRKMLNRLSNRLEGSYSEVRPETCMHSTTRVPSGRHLPRIGPWFAPRQTTTASQPPGEPEGTVSAYGLAATPGNLTPDFHDSEVPDNGPRPESHAGRDGEASAANASAGRE